MLRFLSDEDVPGDIVRGLRQRQPMIDIVRVQEIGMMRVLELELIAIASDGDEWRDRVKFLPL